MILNNFVSKPHLLVVFKKYMEILLKFYGVHSKVVSWAFGAPWGKWALFGALFGRCSGLFGVAGALFGALFGRCSGLFGVGLGALFLFISLFASFYW